MTLGLDGKVNSSIRTITPNNITHANMTAKYSSSPLAPGSKIREFGMK